MGIASPTALEVLGTWCVEAPVLPDDRFEFATEALIDTMGCIAAGTAAPLYRQLSAYQSLNGGEGGETSLLFSDRRASPVEAAMINATAGHSLELDDWDAVSEAHVSTVLFPTLLSLGESRRLSGRELLDAYLVGYEAAIRIGQALNPGHLFRGWHPTANIGALAAAVAGSRLLNLDARQVASAVSLATMTTGMMSHAGFPAKPLLAGYAAAGGVKAVLLAKAGVVASTKTLAGPFSLEALRSDENVRGFEQAFARLPDGDGLATFGLIQKYYPCCGCVHRPIDGVLRLREGLSEGLAEVKEIRIIGPRDEFKFLQNPRPADTSAARFSIEFGAAVAYVRGAVEPADYSLERINDPSVLEALEKISVETYEPKLDPNSSINYPPVTVKFVMESGEVRETVVEFAKGWPAVPLTRDEIKQKFLSLAEPIMGKSGALGLYETLRGVGALENIGQIALATRPSRQ